MVGRSKIFTKNSCTFEKCEIVSFCRSVDEVAAGGKTEIRGDAESVGFNETFTLRIQARLRKKVKTVTATRSEQKLTKRELEEMYLYITLPFLLIFRAGRSLTDEQVKTLRQAKKDGQLSGALLDIRTKSKSDKYA